MNLNYHYWFFKKAVSNKFCDAVIKLGLEKKPMLGTVGTEEENNFFIIINFKVS